MSEEQRIDKWLWATRVFKTRSIAADACKKGRVTIGERQAKPSQMVRIGDVVNVRKPPVTFSFEVVGLTNNRVGAKLVENYLKNITTPDQYELLELHRTAQEMGRQRGTGRPTKKERRDMEQFFNDSMLYWAESDEDLDYDLNGFWDEEE